MITLLTQVRLMPIPLAHVNSIKILINFVVSKGVNKVLAVLD